MRGISQKCWLCCGDEVVGVDVVLGRYAAGDEDEVRVPVSDRTDQVAQAGRDEDFPDLEDKVLEEKEAVVVVLDEVDDLEAMEEPVRAGSTDRVVREKKRPRLSAPANLVALERILPFRRNCKARQSVRPVFRFSVVVVSFRIVAVINVSCTCNQWNGSISWDLYERTEK